MFKYRVPDEIRRKLTKMEPPTYAFAGIKPNVIYFYKETVQKLMNKAFESGYKQAVKEMKEYFNIKGNGVHTRYEE